MELKRTKLEDVLIVTPNRFVDPRGYFVESYNASRFADTAGVDVEFVQDNESLSTLTGTVRGLHFQHPPFSQGKLVRVTHGSVFDVAVDLRASSPTYRQYLSVELSAYNGAQLWIPPGFAHGFCSLEPDTVIAYKVTNYYNGPADQSLHWLDPAIAIEWPDVADSASVSKKDRDAPNLAELEREGAVFE